VHIAPHDGRHEDAGAHFVARHRPADHDARGALADRPALETRLPNRRLAHVRGLCPQPLHGRPFHLRLFSVQIAHGAAVDQHLRRFNPLHPFAIHVAVGAAFTVCHRGPTFLP